MEKQKRNWQDGAIESLIIIPISLVLMSIVAVGGLSFANQCYEWLRTGNWPVRDIYWLLSPSLCNSTTVSTEWWISKEICRVTGTFVTNYVGLNQIVDWVFRLNLAIVSVLVLLLFWLLVIILISITESYRFNSKHRKGR